jgi:peptide/nickel transport system substrate-binding protein
MSLVTEPLERLSSTTTYKPCLAASVTQPNAKTIKYTIRPGVKFSDGSLLTAQDVVWSIEHYASPSASSASQMPAISSVAATGPLSVTVKLKSADPIARAELALTVYVMERKFAVAHAKDLGTASAVPVGTGPYVVKSDTSQGVTLVRNPRYWGQYPKVQKLTFPIITDQNAGKLALQSGTVDAATVTDLKNATQWKQISGASLYMVPTSSSDFIGFDVTKAPFNDVNVRKAIAYAIDKAGMASAGFGNNVSTLNGMVPAYEVSDVAGSIGAAQDFLKSLPQYSFDEAKAKAQMANSAHPNGFSTTVLYVETAPWMKLVGLVLQQELKPLGINVQLKPVTLNNWFTQFFTGKLKGMSIASHFNATVNDPDGLLTTLVGKDGSGNFSHWTTAQLESALLVLKSSQSSSVRWSAAKTVLSGIAAQVPYIPLFTQPSPIVLKQGFVFASKSGVDLYDLANGDWIYQVRASK